MPGQEVQRNLAAVVLDQGQPEPLRSAAAIELCRHIQTFGRLVTEVQVKNLEEAHAALPESKFRLNVALVLGSLRPDPRVTGERLQRYVPAFDMSLTEVCLPSSPAGPVRATVIQGLYSSPRPRHANRDSTRPGESDPVQTQAIIARMVFAFPGTCRRPGGELAMWQTHFSHRRKPRWIKTLLLCRHSMSSIPSGKVAK